MVDAHREESFRSDETLDLVKREFLFGGEDTSYGLADIHQWLDVKALYIEIGLTSVAPGTSAVVCSPCS